MTRDAKQAAKLEKKLKILLGGYQVCSPFGVDLVRLWLLQVHLFTRVLLYH